MLLCVFQGSTTPIYTCDTDYPPWFIYPTYTTTPTLAAAQLMERSINSLRYLIMTVSNTGMTLGSIFGAITTTANTVSNTLDALNNGVGMLNKVVTDASKRQQIDSVIDMDQYLETALVSKAQAETEQLVRVDAWLAEDASRKAHFNKTYDRLAGLFKDKAN